MGFFKGLGNFAGEVTGKVIGGSVRVVGEITGSHFVKEIGDGVEKATIIAGRTAGNLASGIYDTAAGVITSNEEQSSNGMKDIGGAVTTTAKGVVGTVKYTYNNGKDMVVGFVEEDNEKIKNGAKGLIKVAAVATLAVGILDFVDGADGVDSVESSSIENPNMHDVEPHYVSGYERADGTHVDGYFRDGDGDTQVDNPDGGYSQHNPNYKA
ncbi:hypothetical protein ACP8HI_01595 [Paenibacillus sp. FA6]|uniref:hypothetical protein n=1 Tax=Paenibacillus sp. FA6 TaxID=3413029 RepID=UPI003F657402